MTQLYNDSSFGAFYPSSLTWDSNQGRYLDYQELQNLYTDVRNEQQQVWDREDSAVQRWVEDVRKAGLNPLSFTGTGASSAGQSPSAIAASSLIQALSYNLDRKKLNWNQNNAIFDRVLNFFDSVIGAL